ncbi:phage holin family protein [Echinicola strongylocentroti]|uniref:Phage holin family protein n=1 Tax=Echinicola strongylocentroti TaxID=1795355 RepID=A0A2Z4IIH6_9BACT|nr:phage holin family protein [Echinicola strongylocentroti]AWW30931.1 phage holin family protein [Echinicola strongylocentroti]
MMLNFSEIINTVKRLIEVKIQMLKNDLQDELSAVITRVAILSMMVIVSVLILLFGSIALAFYFAELTYSNSLGFLYVGLIYVGLLVFLYIIKDSKGIQKNIGLVLNTFLFFRKKNSDDNE